MSFRNVVSVLVIGLSGVGFGQSAVPFPTDGRLKSAISLRLKCVSFTDFADALKKQTKVRFSIAPDLGDRKITIIFHDRPTAEVMKAVQDAFFMEWKKVGDGYRLTLPTRWDREEHEQLLAEEEAVKAGLQEAIQHLVEISNLSEADLAARKTAVKSEIAQLANDNSPEAQEKVTALRDERVALGSLSGAAISRTLASDIPGAVDRLLDGQTLCASTATFDNVPKLPAGFMDPMLKIRPELQAAMVMLRYKSATRTLEARSCYSSSDRRTGNTVGDLFFYHPLLHHAVDRKGSKLMQHLATWMASPDTLIWGKPLDPSRNISPPPLPYYSHFGQGYTLAEHMEYVADHADIPVIADAFRVFCSPSQFRSEMTVGAYADGLLTSFPARGGLGEAPVRYVTAKNGWLMARHSDYWHRLSTEIAESALLPMEASAQTQPLPSATDYAELAAKLSVEQASPVISNPFSIAVRFDAAPLQHVFYSLKLWATLNEEQAAAAARPEQWGNPNPDPNIGLKLSLLDSSQKRWALASWAEQMWSGGMPISLWANVLSRSGFAATNPILHFRGEIVHRPKVPPKGAQVHPEVQQGPGVQGQMEFRYQFGTEVILSDMAIYMSTHPQTTGS